MPSPFPGMNPYLEHPSVWHDLHESLIYLIREQLTPQLRPEFIARIDERVYIHDASEEPPRFLGRADVGVSQLAPASESSGGVAVRDAPARVRLPQADRFGMSYLEIWDREGQHVVAVVEVLSPSNKKPGKDRDQYLVKRHQLLGSGTNLIEIDLLRAHPRMPMAGLQPCDYCVLVSRSEQWPVAGVWTFGLRDPIPPLPVPLRSDRADARIDLKAALDRAYDGAAYADVVYGQTPEPPLSAADAAWAAQFVPSRA